MMIQKQRKWIGYLTVVMALVVFAGGLSAFAALNGNALAEAVNIAEGATVVESPFTKAVRDVRDSVVGVDVYQEMAPRGNNPFGRGYGFEMPREEDAPKSREVLAGGGSGVVVAPGYVITNYHVVKDASRLEITAGDKVYEATVIVTEQAMDLAILEARSLDLEPVTLGDSDLLNIGDWAICIGNPLSFTGTTTVGVISGINREIKSASTDRYGLQRESVTAMIQTDAAINAGNSGGGMFNVAGELVGIPCMKYTGSFYSGGGVEGIGMAIPINAAKPLIYGALDGKTVPSEQEKAVGGLAAGVAEGKPRMGVSLQTLQPANGLLPRGAYIADVEKGAPAERAGLKVGDIVVEADGTVISTSTELVEIVQGKKAGDEIALKIYRVEGLDAIERWSDIPTDGEYIDITVKLEILDAVKQ